MGHVALIVGAGLWRAVWATWELFWESLYGLTFGFLLSAVVQVLVPQRLLRRYATGRLRGIAAAAGFGAISSSCSYGSAAATRSLYRRGADARAALAFLVSSTNMNVAILVMFWVLVGWKFAFAEFVGGIIIIAVVAVGLTLLFPGDALDKLRDEAGADDAVGGEPVTEDAVCGMAGRREHAVTAGGQEFWFCNAQHARQFAADPAAYADLPGRIGTALAEQGHTAQVESEDVICGMAGSSEHTVVYAGRTFQFCSPGCRDQFSSAPDRHANDGEPARPPLSSLHTWYEITQRAWGDVQMLRTELLIGYLLAGFAEGLIPKRALASALHTIGGVPVLGYVLLLLLGLAIAVATFVCSMGNVPVAAFLKSAGIPLGANTTYIYGDLLILPLVRIYQRSFPRKLTAAFLALFVLGACVAGALMQAVIGQLPGGL